MPAVTKPDPFNAVLLESPPLMVTMEQARIIREILETACSDSRFAEKAYTAIWRILTSGSAVPPVVTSLNPSSAALGSPSFDLHVMGTGFAPGSVIVWNGSEEPTTRVSDTELTTGVDMSTAEVAIPIPVSVLNTDGVMSDPLTFNLTEVGRTITKKPTFVEKK